MKIKIRDWTFTHWWVRPVVWSWFKIYHKRVCYSGTTHIDWERPIIFAPSHQNAFMDALCLKLPASFTNNRFIYPLIRADAFGKNRFIDWVLTSFHMFPVYRPRDGVDLKAKNESVFMDCHTILAKNRNLLIHPEGNCIPKKRVRRFKKGLARIAFGAEEAYNYQLGVQIIPVGINYREITEPRKGIHIQYGSPVLVSDFIEPYKQNPATGINQLTDEIKWGVEKITVDISSEENYRLTEELIRIKNQTSPRFSGSADYTKQEVEDNKELVRRLEEACRERPNLSEELETLAKRLKKLIKEQGLDTERSLHTRSSSMNLIARGVLFLVLLPVILYGWINNIIPWFLIHRIADRIKETQFKSSARLALGLLIFPSFYLLQALLFLAVSDSWSWTSLYLFTIPFSGLLSLNSWEKIKEWKQERTLKRLSRNSDKNLTQIYSLIQEIFSKLDYHPQTMPLPDAAESKKA